MSLLQITQTNMSPSKKKKQCIGHMEPPIDNTTNICQHYHHLENDGQTSSTGHFQAFFTQHFPRNKTVTR